MAGRGLKKGREREVESNSKRHCKLGVSVSYSALGFVEFQLV